MTARPPRRGILASLWGPLFSWARQKSRVGLGVVGALPDARAGFDGAAWADARLLPIGVPTDAQAPRHADLLVVVGRVSHKLAPFLVRAHASMARPAQVLVVDLEPSPSPVPRTYASLDDLAHILPVDVVIKSPRPRHEHVERALAALDARSRAQGVS